MAGTTGYVNTPPATALDRRIVKGMLLYSGLNASEQAIDKGVRLTPSRPDGYVYETRGAGIIAGLSATIVIIIIVTLLRLSLRRFSPGLTWGLDDSLMCGALLMAIAYPALQIAMVVYGGAGKHIYDVKYVEYYHYKWLANLASIDFYVCVGVLKMSITAFNLRVTSMTSSKWRTLNWIFFIICGCYTIVAFFLNLFQCNPTGASFDLLLVADRGTAPRCEGVKEMGTILRTINFVLDWCLVLIPVAVLWKVQMRWAKKGRLIGAMTVGSLACVASVLTLVAKNQLTTDPLWNYTGILGWSMAELTITTIAASLPTLVFLLPGSRNRSVVGDASGSQGTDHAAATAGRARLSALGKRSHRLAGDDDERIMTTVHAPSASSREDLDAAERGSPGIMRTIDIELESKKRASSNLDSEENPVVAYGSPGQRAVEGYKRVAG